MKLTSNNYYTPKNKYLSNSKISDYLKDPWYFYQKDIKHEIEFKQTTPMLIGSAVDTWLTDSFEEFEAKYSVEKDEDKIKLTPLQIDTVCKICTKMEQQSAYKEVKSYRKQNILQVDLDNFGIWKGLCGIPDWFRISKNGEHCIIVDLKTTASIDSRKFHYKCLDFGYYRQQAMYRLLISANYPKVRTFEHRILAVQTGGLFPVKTFIFDSEFIQDQLPELQQTISEIINTKSWRPPDTRWDESEILPL